MKKKLTCAALTAIVFGYSIENTQATKRLGDPADVSVIGVATPFSQAIATLNVAANKVTFDEAYGEAVKGLNYLKEFVISDQQMKEEVGVYLARVLAHLDKRPMTPGKFWKLMYLYDNYNCIADYLYAASGIDAVAMLRYAVCLQRGLCGMMQNAEEAVRYFELAAARGHAEAQYNLGMCLYNGIGVEKDDAKAVHYFQLAAERDHAKAQYELGVRLYNGVGVEKDDAKAVHYFQLAAAKDHAEAQYCLGVCLYDGLVVENDDAEAVRYFQLAAEQGHVEAQYELGMCLYNGEGIEKDDAEAVHWFELAAERGHAEAQYKLGMCLYNGEGIEKDDAEAVHWFELAAEQGHEDAIAILRQMAVPAA